MSINYTYARAIDFTIDVISMSINLIYMQQDLEECIITSEVYNKPIISWSSKNNLEFFSSCDIHTFNTISKLIYFISQNINKLELMDIPEIIDTIYKFYNDECISPVP